MTKNVFHWADYVVFVVVIVISFGIGMYYAFIGGKQKTTSEYLMANRKLGILPVALSILVSFISSILIIGFPAEVYHYGPQFIISNIGMAMGCLAATFVAAPKFYALQFTSINEYMVARYHSVRLKQLACILGLLGGICFLGVHLYLPAAAVQASSNIPIWVSIVVAGGISTVYTTLGGMKAVVWTDVFQSFVMVGGLLAISIQGAIKVGGVGKVWELCSQGDRLNFFNFNPDPTIRMNFWGLTVGNSIFYIYVYGVSQSSMQRYTAVKSLKKAQRSILLVMPGHFIMVSLAVWIGMTVYAFYHSKGCDPMKEGLMSNPNQIIPYFVIENLAYPGFPGLFTACIWAGSLSTLSSMLTSMATNLWGDFLAVWFTKVPEAKHTIITKITVFSFGCVGIGVSFILGNLGGLVYQVAITIASASFSPILTLFVLGMCFPFANKKGAFAAVVASFALCLWIAIGSYTIEKHKETLPVPSHNCSINTNYTLLSTLPTSGYNDLSSMSYNTTVLEARDYHGSGFLHWFYSISFLFIKFFGLIVGLIAGVLVSLSTGRNGRHIDPRLVLTPTIRLFGMKEIENRINEDECVYLKEANNDEMVKNVQA